MVPSLQQSLRQIASQLLVQVAQIHFQRSALTGLVMLAALASVSRWAAAGAAAASVTALITARLLRQDGAAAWAGLFGYNASLTGAGLLSLYAPSFRLFAYLIAVSAISTAVSARWVRWGRLPALTLQFVLAMWGAAALGGVLGSRVPLDGCDGGLETRWLCGIGQISFIAGTLPGLCVWAALTWHDRRGGLWLALGAGAGLLLAQLPGIEAQSIGLMVNLALIAQGLTVFGRSTAMRILGLALGAGLCLLCGALRLTYFTLPFNLATWTILLLGQRAEHKAQQAGRPGADRLTSGVGMPPS